MHILCVIVLCIQQQKISDCMCNIILLFTSDINVCPSPLKKPCLHCYLEHEKQVSACGQWLLCQTALTTILLLVVYRHLEKHYTDIISDWLLGLKFINIIIKKSLFWSWSENTIYGSN